MELISALSEGRFKDLLGTAESEWLDFKSAPYQLDTPKGRFELAKDLAAFANVQEAFIVLGVGTERHPHEVVESAVSISEIPKVLIHAGRYRDIISAWVFPQIRNLAFKWFPEDAAIDRGIFVIQVGHQIPRDRYFLVRRMFDESGEEIAGIGIPIRDGDRAVWLPPEEIHRLVRDGLLAERLGPSPAAPEAPARERIKPRLQVLEELQGWNTEADLFLVALPQGEGQQIEDFYSQAGMWGVLSDPPSLRGSGFNLRTGKEADVVGESLVARRVGDVAYLLDADGLFIAGAGAHRDFLGWSINDQSQDVWTWVNPIVLVEFTLEFFRFVHLQLKARLPDAEWRFQVHCRRFRTHQILLAPGVLRGRPMGYLKPPEAYSDDWLHEIEDAGNPGRNAWRALSLVYALFNLPTESIPYARDGEISEEIVAAL